MPDFVSQLLRKYPELRDKIWNGKPGFKANKIYTMICVNDPAHFVVYTLYLKKKYEEEEKIEEEVMRKELEEEIGAGKKWKELQDEGVGVAA